MTASTHPPALTTSPSKLQAFRLFLRRIWALSQPYFVSDQKWKARLLLGASIGLNLALVYMNVLFND